MNAKEIRKEYSIEVTKLNKLRKELDYRFNTLYKEAAITCDHDWEYIIEYQDRNFYRCKKCESETYSTGTKAIAIPKLQKLNLFVINDAS